MRIITALVAISLSGCVSNYQAPSGNTPTAAIVISADKPSVTGSLKADFLTVQLFSDEKCAVSASGTNLARFAGLAKSDDFEGSQKNIVAGQPIVISFFHFAGLYGSNQCTVTYSFTPEVNAVYKAHFSRTSGQCQVSLELESGASIADLKRITPGCSK